MPLATPGEAHVEWHLNSGVPMGQPGCPQDACHLPDDLHEPEPEPGEGIRCAHCKGRHWTVADVRACAASHGVAVPAADPTPTRRDVPEPSTTNPLDPWAAPLPEYDPKDPPF